MKAVKLIIIIALLISAGLVYFFEDSLKAHLENYIPEPSPLVNLHSSPKPQKKQITQIELNAVTPKNQSMDAVLAKQAAEFQRCRLNRVVDIGEIKGLVLLGVTVFPNGRVTDVSLLQSNISDKQLIQCLTSSIYKAVFQPFEGEAIQRAYPIEFE